MREIASPEEVPGGSAVIIRSHGVSRAVEQQARNRPLRIFDATCPLVTKVHREVVRMRERGKTIIMISSEMPELLGMCDRIMVMHEGHKMGELNAAEATQAKIMALCS